MPSALRCPDVRLLTGPRTAGKSPLEDPGQIWAGAGQERRGGTLRSEQPRPSPLHPPTVPPGDAPSRVRGLGLRDSGRLAVRAALGWPFPAL